MIQPALRLVHLGCLLLATTATASEPCPVVLTPLDAGVDFHHQAGKGGAMHLPETMAPGLAWIDYDGDGLLDLYAVQSGPFPPQPGEAAAADRLYRNLGESPLHDTTAPGWRFAEAGALGGLATPSADDIPHDGYGMGVLAVDLEGDRDLDLLVTQFGRDLLWRNRGDGHFEVATDLGLGTEGWSSSAAAADADADGDLDLYLTRYLEYDPAAELYCGDLEGGDTGAGRTYCDPSIFDGAGDRFYRQEEGRFVDVTTAAGVAPAAGKGLGVVFVDLDGDRLPEIYVANDITPNFLFQNLGPSQNLGARFAEVALFAGAAANASGQYEAGMGLAVGDVEGDGDPDLAVTNFDVETNTLYRNLGELQFTDVAAESGFGVPSFNLLGFGIVLADLDRDGDLDAYVANGHIFERPPRDGVSFRQRDLLLIGDGSGGFSEPHCPDIATRLHVARGLAAADFDGDGDLDLAIGVNDGPLELLRNDTAGGGWLGVALRGRPPNSQAIGAVVTLADDGGRQQRRWIIAGDSYQSSSDRRALFGLGSGAPRELVVTWPAGERQRIVGPPAGRYLIVDERDEEAP